MSQELIKYFESISAEEREYLLSTLEPKKANIVREAIRAQLGLEDPVWWLETSFGVKFWEKQQKIIQSVWNNRRTSVISCHGAGKSFVAAHIAMAFLYLHEDSVVITTAPTERQVAEVLWGEIRHAHGQYNLDGEILRMQLRLREKWKAFGFSTDDPNAFQGHHTGHMLVIFDEASGIAPEIWEAAEGVLTGDGARILCIGNPTDPASKFKDEFDSPATTSFQVSAFDCPNLSRFNITEETLSRYAWGESEKFMRECVTGPLPYPNSGLVDPAWVFDKYHRWRPGSPMWQSRVLGEFPAQGSDCLIPIGWIERAIDKDLPATLPHELGIDVAYMGSDYNVVAERFGAKVKIIKRFHGMNKAETVRILSAIIDERIGTLSAVKVDNVGYGAAVYEDLAEKYGYNLILSCHGAEASSEIVAPGVKKTFLNRRAEMHWNLRERFEREEISISSEDEDLISQAKIIKYQLPNGQIKIEGKEDMRKRLGRSPDDMDAVVYCFAQDKNQDIPCVGLADDLVSRSQWSLVR